MISLVVTPCFAWRQHGSLRSPRIDYRQLPFHVKCAQDWQNVNLERIDKIGDCQSSIPFPLDQQNVNMERIDKIVDHRFCSRKMITLSGTVPNLIFFNILIQCLNSTNVWFWYLHGMLIVGMSKVTCLNAQKLIECKFRLMPSKNTF